MQVSNHRCPYCFASLPKDSVFRQCPVRVFADGTNCRSARAKKFRAAETPSCNEHAGVELVLVCHNNLCNKQLPFRWNEVTTTCLAMAGTRNAGKSVYIGVTADVLVKWGRRQGMTVTHYNEESKRNYEMRFGRLNEDEASVLASTEREHGSTERPQQEPILLRIQRPGVPDHVLVLRDVAGEDLQDATMDPARFRFLSLADGLILLVDPADFSPVVNALTGQVDIHPGEVTASAVWGNLQNLQFSHGGDKSRYVPVALTISKFDLVKQAAEQRRSELANPLSGKGLRLRHDPSLSLGGFDRMDSDLLDAELRSLLRHLGASQLLTRADHYAANGSSVRVFAVSALGQPPKVGKIAVRSPFRCMDPVLWFFERAGVRSTLEPV